MKNIVTILIGCLILGVGISVITKNKKEDPLTEAKPLETGDVKPAKVQSSAEAVYTPSSKASSGADTSAEVKSPDVEKTEEELQAERQARRDKWMADRKTAMATRLTARYANKVAAIAKELGLDETQTAHLQAYYDAQVDILSNANPRTVFTDAEAIPALAASLREEGLGEHMAEVMTEEQQASLLAIQERKKSNEVESKAMTNFAKLQTSLDLTDEQKDKVYTTLLEDSETRSENQSDGDYVMRSYMQSMGMHFDMGDMDMGNVIEIASSAQQGEEVDQEQMLADITADRDAQIEAKVERMSSVLDETQLNTYRTQLNNQGSMFTRMIQGMSRGGGGRGRGGPGGRRGR